VRNVSELSKDELIAIGRELVERLLERPKGQFEVKSDRMTSLGHLPLVHAFSTHALRLGAAGLDMFEAGLHLESVPTIRAAYEAALTASWTSDSREAPAAVFNEDVRQRTNLAKAMGRANSEVFREGGPKLPYVDVDKLATAADAQARWFEQMCMALQPGGPDAYVIYRGLSAFAHPSAALADKYVEENPDHPSGMRLLTNPNGSEDSTWLFMLVASMVWAARALDVMVVGRPNRNYLRQVARRLGIAEVLRLSQEAFLSEQSARSERRRAEWKGPNKQKRRRRDTDSEA
jgi:hypothetical protein